MIKRLFGMEFLNITQGRFGGFSHKLLNAYDLAGKDSSIDNFIARADYEIIGVYPFCYSTQKGFGNTVHFYDKENNVTLAMTHTDKIAPFRVGDIVKNGTVMYSEGTTGRATGNHIHLEIGTGKQNIKKYINGYWRLQNCINIEDYFYIDDTIKIKNDCGYFFEKRGDEQVMTKTGYQVIKYKGATYHIYVQNDLEHLGMISASKDNDDYKALKTIDKITDDPRIHYAKINCNYFELGALNRGQHFGVEITPQVEFAPKQKEWLALYQLKNDKELKYCNADEFYYSKNDVNFACSPYSILYHDFKETSIKSTACANKDNVLNTQTFLIQLKDNSFLIGVCTTKVKPKFILTFAKAYFKDSLKHLSLYDSGGSSQMVVHGKPVVYTGRAIANVLTLFRNPQNTATNKVEVSEDLETLKNEIKALKEENAKLKALIEKVKEVINV